MTNILRRLASQRVAIILATLPLAAVVGTLAGVMLAGAPVASAAPPSDAAPALASCNTSTLFRSGSTYWYWPTAGGNPNCVMGRGNVSTGVSILQLGLNRCYGQGLTVDGNYGPATERAVRNVQATIGAAEDGVYGPETRSKMGWYTYPSGSCIGHG